MNFKIYGRRCFYSVLNEEHIQQFHTKCCPPSECFVNLGVPHEAYPLLLLLNISVKNAEFTKAFT